MHLSRTYLDMKKQRALEENLFYGSGSWCCSEDSHAAPAVAQLKHVLFLEAAWGRAPQLNCSVHTGFPMNPYVPIPIQVTRNIPETGLKGCALPCFHCLKGEGRSAGPSPCRKPEGFPQKLRGNKRLQFTHHKNILFNLMWESLSEYRNMFLCVAFYSLLTCFDNKIH